MTENEIFKFRSGYHECRAVILFVLKKIIGQNADVDIRADLAKLIAELASDIEREHWEAIQKEFPGISRQEYEEECKASAELIRKTYYSKQGYLKPRLVRR